MADLAARQSGDSVVLTFTLPNKSTEDAPLGEPPTVEIYRGTLAAGAPPEKASPPLAHTIPAAAVDTYVSEGQIKFIDPLKPEEVATRPGEQMVYIVRTRVSKRRASADSNPAAVRVYPVPEPIADLRAEVTETMITLSWSPPARTTSGAPLASLAGYRVYRAEAEPHTQATPAQDLAQAKLRTPLELLDTAPSPSLRDTRFEFGRSYLYTVRSVAQHDSEAVESADSRPVVVTPRDIFPPAPPEGLVAVPLPAAPPSPPQVDLSWALSAEPDLAGYHIYRREQTEPDSSARGERLSVELLLTPTFRDNSVQPGHRYTYRVAAMDRAGNESAPGDGVTVEVPGP